jgi:hypothetical protein
VVIEALDQLLDYLIWSDCKASLIPFNKKISGFSGIQKTISSVLPVHASFIRYKSEQPVCEWRAMFRSREGIERGVTVYISCFILCCKAVFVNQDASQMKIKHFNF